MKTVTIAGVGLIGGSFALALRKAGFQGKILGVSSPRTVAEALKLGVIDEALPLEEAIPQSDLVYLAQPIRQILDTLPKLDRLLKPGALVTDAGSTKREIASRGAASIRRALFLGGHPMAGKESRGVGAAEADLFVGRPYVVTPSRPGDLEMERAAEFLAWISRIGSRLITMEAAEHDRVVALASHLPQLASTALAATLGGHPVASGIANVAGPGLVDTTRLALSPFDVWADIFATNQVEVERALSAYINDLEAIRRELSSGSLEDHFRAAGKFAEAVRKS